MRASILISLLFPLVTFGAASATEPCVPMTEGQFMEQVAHRSDLIVFAKILDYSGLSSGGSEGAWTTIETVEQVFSKQDNPPGVMTIRGWQAKAEPLFAYEKGDFLLLFLERKGTDYFLKDDSWKHCVPSIWNARPDKTVYRNVMLADRQPGGWVPLAEIVDSLAD